MISVKYNHNNKLIDCEVKSHHNDTYEVCYYDKTLDRCVTIWVHKTTLVFPKFEELIV
jgi:hypothetical protein